MTKTELSEGHRLRHPSTVDSQVSLEGDLFEITVKVGINGFSRVGRSYFRALAAFGASLEVVTANDLTDSKTPAHLLKYNFILERFLEEVPYDDDAIKIGGKGVKTFAGRDPASLPWGELGVDIVVESAGFFTDATKAKAHLDAGAEEVLISTPAKSEGVTIVIGVNDDKYDPAAHNIISNASCTTNYLAPMAKTLNDSLGIAKGLMTTIHAYAQDQNLQDGPHRDLHHARATTLNIVPTTMGAVKATALMLPELKGELDGCALRVPTPTDSATDLTFEAPHETSVEEINKIVKKTADGRVLVYTGESLVSKDIGTDSASYAFDFQLTKVIGNQVKIVGWYDNKWDYSNHLVDLTALVGSRL